MNLLLAAALLFAAGTRDTDRELARQRKELDALRSQLEAGQKELAQLKAKKSATVDELEKLSNNIAMTDQYLRKLESVESQLADAVDTAQEQLRGTQGRLDARSDAMARRARVLFMQGRPERLLFGSPAGESDFFRRVYWVKRMVRQDRRLVGETREDFGRQQLPVSVHSPGHIAETDDAAAEQLWPHYSEMYGRIGRERGWNPPSKQQFMAEIAYGSLYVGSPETVAVKIASAMRAVGADRFDFKYCTGPMPHALMMKSIELYATAVVPRVREILAD